MKQIRLISLNVWGGNVYGSLLDFFRRYAKETDVFCLQEVFGATAPIADPFRQFFSQQIVICYDLMAKIAEVLPDFEPLPAPAFSGFAYDRPVEEPIWFGLACFVRRGVELWAHGNSFIHRQAGALPTPRDSVSLPKNAQWLWLMVAGQPRAIVNYHGLWQPNDKGDSLERLEQSYQLGQLVDQLADPTAVVGDFNLRPLTVSMATLQRSGGGLRSLVTEYGFNSTRSDRYYPLGNGKTRFADDALVAPKLTVHEFAVLQEHVSDHLPLRLVFS